MSIDYIFIFTTGATMLIFTFPVLFVASLGCVYLHLGKKLNDHHNKKERYVYIYTRTFLFFFIQLLLLFLLIYMAEY